MERLVISCKMLSDELHKVCEGKKNIPRIIELERGMHNNPKRLQEILQEQIHENQDVDEIVLTYGLCGNGTLGLMSPKTKLIIPKFDDCISQLLYQDCIGRKKRSEVQKGHLYVTRGWTLDQEAILPQCQNILSIYGADTGKEIINQIYGGYQQISIIDTKAYDMHQVENYVKNIKKYLNVEVENVCGSTDILEKIISGNYDDNFIILSPGEVLEEKMFRFNGK